MRKLLSVLMAAIMLVSFAPLALANEITPASTITKIEIKDADITPVAGLTPADMGYGNMYADGSSSIISNTDGWWYCDSTMSNLEEEDTFEVGKRYSYCWLFELNSGYTVSSSTYVTINGSRANVDEQSTDLEEGMIWSNSVYCEEQLGGEISLVEITGVTLTPPAGGRAGDYMDFVTDFELPVLTDDVYWWCETKHTRLSDDSAFEEGFSYSLHIDLEPMPGYTFSNETEVYINGLKDNVSYTNLYEGILYIVTTAYYCGTPSEPIIVDKVELSDVTIAPPVGGKVYDYLNVSTPDGAHYEFVSARWCFASDGMELDMNYEFEADKEYCLHISLFTEYGYNFTEDTKIFINGRDDLHQSSLTNVQPNILNICTVAAESVEANVIDKVELTGVTLNPPVGGKVSDYLNVSFNDTLPIKLVKTFWNCEGVYEPLAADYEFEEGKIYSMCIVLEPTSGYKFTNETVIVINGSEDSFDSSRSYITEAGVYYISTVKRECTSAPEIQYIDKVSVTVTEVPLAGGKAGDYMSVTIPEGAHFTVSTSFWQNYETYENLSDDYVFEAGKTYHFFFSLYPGDGYLFANDVKIIINGKENNYHAEISHTDEHVLALWTMPAESVEAPSVMLGDLNGDGKVNTADAVVVLKSSAGMIVLDEKQNIAGDCNHDGKVNTADAVIVLKYAAGMIAEL